jgi:hypothetical protein
VKAPATQDLCAHFFAVIAYLAPAVVAVDSTHWSAVVASADDGPLLDDDGAYSLFEAGCSFLQDETDAEKILVYFRAKLLNDIPMVS